MSGLTHRDSSIAMLSQTPYYVNVVVNEKFVRQVKSSVVCPSEFHLFLACLLSLSDTGLDLSVAKQKLRIGFATEIRRTFYALES